MTHDNDMLFIIDQLTNSMEHYDLNVFVEHMSSQINWPPHYFEIIYHEYHKLHPMVQMDMMPSEWAKFITNLLDI